MGDIANRKCRLLILATALATANANGASLNLTQLTTPPGVVNAADPPVASFPFDQAVPFRITSDDQRAVYIEGNAFFSIAFKTPGQPLRLTESLVGDILDFELSADAQWLVYTVETTFGVPAETRQQIYSVKLDASAAPSPIGPPAVITDDAPGGADFQITLDSQQVVFTISEPTDDPLVPILKFAAFSLFRAPIGGGAVIDVAGPTNAIFFDIAEDSSHIVFAETRELGLTQPPLFDLFSVSLDGLQPNQLNANGETVRPGFDITQDGSRVVYATVQENDPNAGKLLTEAIGGGPSTTLAEYAAEQITLTFEATPNGQRVVFASLGGPGNAELRSVSIGGADRDLLSSGLTVDLIVFQLSENSERVVFTAQAGDPNDFRSALFTVPTSVLSPATPTRIAGDLGQSGGALIFPRIQITADSNHIVYGSIRPDAVDSQKPGSTELRRAAIDGSGPTPLLNEPLVGSSARIPYFSASFDSQSIFYIADQATLDVFEIYLTPLVEPAVVQLNGNLPSGGDVAFSFWTLDSGKVVYQADEAEDGLFDLWFSRLSKPSIFTSGFE